MKFGGSWNLRGLRPEARETAREAARRSGMSVGEWLNTIIDQGDDGEPMRAADYYDDDDGWRGDDRHNDRYDSRYERSPSRQRRRRRERDRDYERESGLERDAALAQEEFGEVHARLDRLTNQLDRMARSEGPRLTGAPAKPQRGRPAPAGRPRPADRSPAGTRQTSLDNAVAEINERQRTLYGETQAAAPPRAPSASAPPAGAPSVSDIAAITAAGSAPVLDIAGLERQLRQITTRIETLRPNGELDHVIQAVRQDLAEIRHNLTEALPRHAVESLEIEVEALERRIDHSRESGVEPAALASLEHGLSEVRDALRGLTTAENLVGFDDAVNALAQKVDMIVAKDDPAALQQLETAIDALRGIVSHVASNDTLTKVAEEVRALAAKVDGLANTAATGQAVSSLESRIDTLANALTASTEAGQSVPRELEKLLSGLIEKLEWVQLTHTDHAALGHLEDRIAQLIKRFDASEARFGNLEAVERGLADLLVHLDKVRGGEPASAEPSLKIKLGDADAIEREVAEIKLSERRTLDSLELVHGAVEHVVDRLAIIESDIHRGAPEQPEPGADTAAETAEIVPVPPVAASPTAVGEPASRRTAPPRPPIDPNLPPDHPLEPGTAAGPRPMPSAADRIAASEAAFGAAKPPVIAESRDKPNFIEAARRAAQTAAAQLPYDRPAKVEAAPAYAAQAEKPSRLRKLIVAGGVVLIAIGCLHIASRMFQDGGSISKPQSQSEQGAQPAVLPENDQPKPGSHAGPLVLPVPDGPKLAEPPATVTPEPPPSAAPAPAAPANPGRQSKLHDRQGQPLWATPDVTGSVPRATAPPSAAPAADPTNATVMDKLPATIGGPALRAAALAGDSAAEFEVAMRFAEGHGVPPSNEQAVRWLDRAAKQGLVPAQFRLGGFYEKGIGVKKDLAAARELYLAAADKGNGKAMHNLAVLYAEGVNGPPDYRSAAHWFRKAADRGITDSQFNLAILYARGVGVEQNYAESYKWFLLAANAGDSDAAKKRDEVASHLDQQSLAAAKLAAQKWAAEPQPEDAVNVKPPAGDWDQPAQAAKPKPHAAGPKAADSKIN